MTGLNRYDINIPTPKWVKGWGYFSIVISILAMGAIGYCFWKIQSLKKDEDQDEDETTEKKPKKKTVLKKPTFREMPEDEPSATQEEVETKKVNTSPKLAKSSKEVQKKETDTQKDK